MNHKILVFIPTYRCEAQVARVIDQFDEKVQTMIDTVMIVDNCSPDQTLEISIESGKKTLTKCNFLAWQNENNYGLGGSHKAAFRYAVEQHFDFLIVLHGDDQADIRDLVPMLDAKVHTTVDCLLGARFMRNSHLKGYSWFRTFGNHVYNALFSIAAMKNIHDLGSGLNVYRVAVFQDFFYKSFPDDLTFNYVMLLASYHRKQKVQFFPISWREEDQVSNVKLFSQAYKVLRLLAGFFFMRGAFFASEMREKPFESYSGTIVYRHSPMTES